MWWLLPDSNWGHKALQASALPTELKSHTTDGILGYYPCLFKNQLYLVSLERKFLTSSTVLMN
jgi:hypothetical protein